MQILTDLCGLPTAPFAEQRVIRYIEEFAQHRPQFTLERDRYGNLMLLTNANAGGPRWIFAAHMDHPGFVARTMRGRKTLLADFFGAVYTPFVKDASVLFHDGPRVIKARVKRIVQARPTNAEMPRVVELAVESPVASGCPGLFDVGLPTVKGTRFSSRVCDDLAGAASALAMLDALPAKLKHPVGVLLTRAEEQGFVGALAAMKAGKLLRRDDRIICIECSAEQPYAPQRQGVVIRLGDKTSIFNSALSHHLVEQAQRLQKHEPSFKYQRALMPGGTCEATVYDAWGYITAAVCVPLGNYHNMDRKRGKVAAEHVDLDDWHSMVALLTAVARNGSDFKPGFTELKKRLNKLLADHIDLLK